MPVIELWFFRAIYSQGPVNIIPGKIASTYFYALRACIKNFLSIVDSEGVRKILLICCIEYILRRVIHFSSL
ncbi:hypothetical protein V462_10725 [Pantoea ananatis 15320]|nr:hypothetical protein V462_10725 [Pantoea ananatis 15320]